MPRRSNPSGLAEETTRELLETANENTLCGPALGYRYEAHEDTDSPKWQMKTMFRQPASEIEISALEERLGVSLPQDYKDFLRVTNRFSASESRTTLTASTMGIVQMSLCFALQVKRVDEDWLEWPCDILDIPREIEDLGDVMATFGVTPVRVPLFERLIEFGFRDIYHLFLVPPDLVRRAREAYEVMYSRADEEQKAIIDRAIVRFAGSREVWEQLEWSLVRMAVGGTAYAKPCAGFRRYLEQVTADSMQTY